LAAWLESLWRYFARRVSNPQRILANLTVDALVGAGSSSSSDALIASLGANLIIST